MKTSSAKAKGRRLQQELRDSLLKAFPELEADDVKVAIMGESGVDIKLSPAARKKIPYAFECKNQEKISVWDALKQAEENANNGSTPSLVFKRNHSKTYIALPLEHFIQLISNKALLTE